MIDYRNDYVPTLAQARELYRSCSLGARRPIDDDARFAAMLANANLTVTAWDAAQLVGIARSVSDFAYCTYLSDLAVRESHQRRGIGRELMQRTRDAAPEATLILLAAPAAVEYYPRVGFTRHDSAWLLKAGESLR
jgi:GNAT superfamily N-acetyltransferase